MRRCVREGQEESGSQSVRLEGAAIRAPERLPELVDFKAHTASPKASPMPIHPADSMAASFVPTAWARRANVDARDGTRKVLASLLERFSRWIERERAAAQAERNLMAKTLA